MVSGIFFSANPAKLVATFFAGHVVAAIGLFDRRPTPGTLPRSGAGYFIWKEW